MYENAVIIKSKKAFILFYVVFAVFLFVSCQKSPTPESKKEVQVEQELKQPSIIEEERGRKSDRIIKTEEPPLVATKETGSEKPEQIKLKETVPFVTEVMSKEEQQIYLKEKGIPIITKENFKEPEILWDRMFDEPLHSIHQPITDLTEKGNSILITGKGQGYVDYIKIYFIDNKGNIHKKLDLGKIEESAYAVAKSGRGAAVCKGSTKEGEFILTYYNEEGNELWKKKIALKKLGRAIISDNGEMVAIEEGNQNWSIEEWGGDLNIVKVVFLDNTGKQLFEYNRFRNIDCGKFSADGRYYVGLFCWQEDPKSWGKLIYIDVRGGKVLWEKLFINNWWKWPEYFDQNSLAISERGSYVAAVDMEPAEKASENNQKDYMEVVVFNKDGKEMMRTKGSYVSRVREDGFLGSGNVKGWIDITRLKSTGLFGFPPYFLRIADETIWETKKGYEGKVGRTVSQKILTLDEIILWEVPKELASGYSRFSRDMRYMIVTKYMDKTHQKIVVYRLNIHLPEGGQER